MSKGQKPAIQTRAVHAGERVAAGDYTPVVTPIHPSVGYLYESMDDLDAILAAKRDGYVYPRYGSPTVAAFEAAIAELEGGDAALAVSSGMAAVHVALLSAGAQAGTCVVVALDVYGATYTMVTRLLAGLGVEVRVVDTCNLAMVENVLIETRPAILLVEIISNPLLKIADVPRLVDLAHRYGARFLIDNTFASPILYNPLMDGADYVIHSATKYIGGHGDVMGGVIVTNRENYKKLFEMNKIVGSVLGPFEAWLALRGLKTMPLRVRQQSDNAQRIAEWLTTQPRIRQVNYPGLSNHPQHALAQQLFQNRGYGGVLSFEIEGADQADAFRFMEALELCMPATTLGDIYTLILHPATSSHRALSSEERQKAGISESLVRLSAGIEAVDDILADLDQALA